MEDLAALLETSFKVSNDMFSTSGVHPRFSQYKAKVAGASDQEVRRRRKLEQQKQARHDYQMHVRNLAQGRFVDMEAQEQPKNQHQRGGRDYRNQLMMSEWMVEVPEDFAENWVMVPCPVARRALVVASHGQTSAWSKGGWLIGKFDSALPGGSRRNPRWNRDSTVLDCLYCELTKTYYVLDMMCWREQPQYDCETEFRFYWMATKFDEIPELKQITKNNKYRFEILPNYSCKAENIQNVLQTRMSVQLDGLLFFHKHTHYTPGSTPLVTWLKPYMVPEILGVEVGEEHMRYKPATYTGFTDHLQKVQAEKEKQQEKDQQRLERRRSGNQRMDTTPTKPSQTQLSQPAATSQNNTESVDVINTANGDVTSQGDDVTAQGDDVTDMADVVIEEEVLIDPPSSGSERISDTGAMVTGMVSDLIGDDVDESDVIRDVIGENTVQVQQQHTGNELPISSDNNQSVSHESESNESASFAASDSGNSKDKSAKSSKQKGAIKADNSQAAAAVEGTMEHDAEKKGKKKPRKLRGRKSGGKS